MFKSFSRIFLLTGLIAFGAQAHATDAQDVYDPLMPVNRVFHEFNKGLDTIVLGPTAEIYEGVVPQTLKTVVSNEIRYLTLPRSFANSVLQGNWDRAGDTAVRFFVNTTIGGLGLLDPATDFNIPEHDEDFDQTLAVWGVEAGPYIELPFLGPYSARGVVGQIGDFALDPLSYSSGTTANTIGAARRAGSIIDTRYRFKTGIDEALYSSPDSYIAVRNLYLQRRANAILNGELSEEILPDIYEADDF